VSPYRIPTALVQFIGGYSYHIGSLGGSFHKLRQILPRDCNIPFQKENVIINACEPLIIVIHNGEFLDVVNDVGAV
jgi:hypothetical protein